MFEIYHQAGFRWNWNLQSLRDDKTGDGIIFGARYIEKEQIEKQTFGMRAMAIFDPQFFVPSVPKGELATYNFFPHLAADGFASSDYAEESAGISAEGCVDFQLANGFRYIVIPTRYMSGMPGHFIHTQDELFVEPFIKRIQERDANTPALLQLVLTDNMLKDAEYCADLLNWITGIKELTGVYLIVERLVNTKQVKDIDLLYRLLSFTSSLRDNDMIVVLGFLNTEAIALTVADPSIVTMGIYENTRMFQIKTFENRESPPKGPNPRLYVSQLLQWISRNYHGAILRMPGGADLFDKNHYEAVMFQPSYNWHFGKSELYKHHLLELSKQLKTIATYEGKERYQYVSELIQQAMKRFRQIDEAGIVLDQDNDGFHLPAWLTAINGFAQDKGWRH